MAKKYKVGYIFDESEIQDVAKFCNKDQTVMIDEFRDESNNRRLFKIVNIPVETLKEQKRSKRDHYLEKYVDPIVTNPLRWEELSKEEQQVYRDYRKYLLDYTLQEKWWLKFPLTLDEWKESKK